MEPALEQHQLRLRQPGGELVAKLLGHSDTGATERYTHIQIEAMQPMVEARWATLTRQ